MLFTPSRNLYSVPAMSITETNKPSSTKPEKKNRVLVLCGGGSRGALEVGFYKALNEMDIHFDMVVGTSIGAFNGAMIAGGLSASTIEGLWQDFDIRQAVSWNWAWPIHPRRQPGLLTLNRFRRLMQDVLPVTRFEDLAYPLTITTTELESGRAVYWGEKGDLVSPMIASMSLPGIFPPVVLSGTQHVDGGIADNAPVDKAYKLGATEIYMIECFCNPSCVPPPRGLISILMRSFSIAVDSKYYSDLAYLGKRIKIFRVKPEFDDNIELMSFSESRELIKVGYDATISQMPGLTSQTV